MALFSEVLINRLNDLEASFKVQAKRIREAGELQESVGRPVPQKLLHELAYSGDQFEEIKREVLELSQSVAEVPQAPELDSIGDLRSFMETVSDVVEKHNAHRDIHQAACGVLDKVLCVIHVDGVEFAPLRQCQEKARELRDSIAETAWPNLHPDVDALVQGQHVFAEFVKLVSLHDRLEDEEWGRLLDLVNQSFGKPLGLAAYRGRLVISASAPPVPEVAVSVAQLAAAAGPETVTVPTEKMTTGEVLAAPLEDQGEDLQNEESSAPVELPTDDPPQMPPLTGVEDVSEADNIEASSGLAADDPDGFSASDGATAASELPQSPAAGSSVIVTSVATFPGTLDDIRYMLALNLIDNKGTAKALSTTLNAASKAADGGNKQTAESFLKAFIDQVNAQTGKHISGAAPQLLLADANSLLGQLQ